MVKNILCLVFIVIGLQANAQLLLSSDTLSFGSVYSDEDGKRSLSVENKFKFSVDVTIYSTDENFELGSTQLSLSAGEIKNIDITFKPHHNIKYNAELLLSLDNDFGSWAVDLNGEGKYKDNYYDATFNLSEEDLKGALKTIISANYKNLGYTGARDAMYASIDNDGGKVTCVYTGRQATFNTRSGANSNSFNTEHTWPQSLFNSNEPERADIHHLFPTDVDANSRRANYPFGVVSNATWTEGGSKLGGSIFEPRDDHKGDAARSMFYFAVRYTNYSSFLTSQETVLRTWAEDDPPTQKSKNRNDAIFSVQKNRNPFVDHPEFLDRITSISSTSKVAVVESVVVASGVLDLDTHPNEYQFEQKVILTNTGNTAVNYTNIKHSRPEFVLDQSSFTLQPGDAKQIAVRLQYHDQLGAVTDTLLFISDKSANSKSVILKGQVNTTSSISSYTVESLILMGNHLQIIGALGSTCAIYNLNGQQVLLNDIRTSFTEIPLQELRAGVYFAVLSSANGEHLVKKIQVLP